MHLERDGCMLYSNGWLRLYGDDTWLVANMTPSQWAFEAQKDQYQLHGISCKYTVQCTTD